VCRVTEGDATRPTTQTQPIANRQNIHTSDVIRVVFLLLLHTEQRDAEKRSSRGTDLDYLCWTGTELEGKRITNEEEELEGGKRG